MGACSTHTPAIPVVVVNSPASIARICPAGTAAFGPAVTSANPTTGNLVLANDGVGATSDGCTAFANAAAVAGNIAMVDRGTCSFKTKTLNAQNAGATAVVMANNQGTTPVNMADDATITTPITIPTLSISLANANAIKTQLANGVNVTLRVRGGDSPPEDSYRWLMGEDSTAFGGAIRDMWTPTCLGDPGKVSDAEYHCDTSDGGGVHSNSGVPNHGYALLVDGGTYNGQTIAAIGLTKAAHLYFRAQTVYQMNTTDFADHAEALEASCSDLIGEPLNNLTTSSTPAGVSGQVFTGADCTAVHAMTLAVELRRDPTQCNFQPMFQQNPPALCGPGMIEQELYKETFEDGLAGWSVSNQGVFAGWPGLDWVADASLPGGRAGTAAYAVDPDAGNCDGGAGDISGVMRLDSPSIAVQGSQQATGHRLSFVHYVATEFGWDGGNLRISINGGPLQFVPASAFTFNPYNTTLQTAAAGNTNPLAGQPAFSGTDGGQVTGSWGESQVDLKALGVKRGDRIRLQFSFGMDGCAGVDGWYVDDVKVSACRPKGKP